MYCQDSATTIHSSSVVYVSKDDKYSSELGIDTYVFQSQAHQISCNE